MPKKRKSLRAAMIEFRNGTMASPEKAGEIMTKRRRGRATREHQKEHPETLTDSPLRRFLLGRNNGLKTVKFESDKKKEQHIRKKMADSKRKKPAENQK